MNCIPKASGSGGVLLICLLFASVTYSQNSLNHPPTAVTILDSTKAQDGLNGSVRRVKTESAKLEVKAGRTIEGQRQLVELTTYDLAGKRVENFSYPVASASAGKEEYEYDAKGNIVAMTMLGDGGSILSKETYTYEFDRFGNWTKMVTSLVVFEGGELKREPVEVTYRSLTYYFDDSVAKMVQSAPVASKAATIPAINATLLTFDERQAVPQNDLPAFMPISVGEPPANRVPPPRSTETPVETAPVAERVAAAPRPANLASRERKVENATPKAEWFQLYRSGVDLFEAGDMKGAVDIYLRTLKLEPNSAEVYLSLGHAYIKLEKNGEAAKAFKECVRLNADLVDGHYGLGLASYRNRRYGDAAEAFKRAIARQPKLARAHFGLAMAYQELKYEKGVAEEYRILQSLDPSLAKQLAKNFAELSFPCRIPPFCK